MHSKTYILVFNFMTKRVTIRVLVLLSFLLLLCLSLVGLLAVHESMMLLSPELKGAFEEMSVLLTE